MACLRHTLRILDSSLCCFVSVKVCSFPESITVMPLCGPLLYFVILRKCIIFEKIVHCYKSIFIKEHGCIQIENHLRSEAGKQSSGSRKGK